VTDTEYLSKLFESAADPKQARVMECHLCGHRFAYRVWPAGDDDVLAIFLDGLARLARRMGIPTYGIWLMVDDVTREPMESDRVQLWRAHDRELLVDTTFAESLGTFSSDHLCAPRN
jgi:hypothetical protein